MTTRSSVPRGSPSLQGFSLVELLIAMTITAALLGLWLALTTTVTGFWNRSAERLAMDGRARLIFDQLERDLESMVWRRDGASWLAATIQGDPPPAGHASMSGESWIAADGGALKPAASEGSLVLPAEVGGTLPPLADYRFGQAGVWLRCVTERPWRQSGGLDEPAVTAPVAVAYQLVRRAPSTGRAPVYQLFRSQVAAPAVLDVGPDLAAPEYQNHDDTPQAPGNLRHPPLEALLGEHVIDFGVRFLVRTRDAGWRVLFPTGGVAEYAPGPGGDFPEVAEVLVRILTDEGASRIERFERSAPESASGAAWWEIAERHSVVFVRRVEIRSRAQ